MITKINAFQKDHSYLEAQMGKCFVLKPNNILGLTFLNTYLATYQKMNKQVYYLPT